MDRDSEYGNGASLTDEIRDLLDHDRINQQAALRLLLLATSSILIDLKETKKEVKANTEARTRTPSIMALFYTRPKAVTAALLALYVLLHSLVEAIPVTAFQRALVTALGLPVK